MFRNLFIILLAVLLVNNSEAQLGLGANGSLRSTLRECFQENRLHLIEFILAPPDPKKATTMMKCFLIKTDLVQNGKFSTVQADQYLDQMNIHSDIIKNQVHTLALLCGSPKGKSDTDAAAEAIAECVVEVAGTLLRDMNDRSKAAAKKQEDTASSLLADHSVSGPPPLSGRFKPRRAHLFA